jgi:hypothetical protein
MENHGQPLDPAAQAQQSHRPAGPITRRLHANRLRDADNLTADPERLNHLIALLEAQAQREHSRATHRPGVLWAGLAVLDANGMWDKTFGDTALAAFVTNLGPQVTVFAGPRMDSAPAQGAGVFLVPMGASIVLNAAAKAWSIYGTAGTPLNVEVFGRPLPPFAGVVEPVPMAAQVLDAYSSVVATQAATTILTVPAGRVWQGQVTLECGSQEAAAGTVAAQAIGVLSVSGAAAPVGNVLRADALAGANAAGGTVGADATGSNASPLVIVASATAPALLQLAATVAGTAGQVNASAVGLLL